MKIFFSNKLAFKQILREYLVVAVAVVVKYPDPYMSYNTTLMYMTCTRYVYLHDINVILYDMYTTLIYTT